MTKIPLNEAVETLAATIRSVGVSSEEAEKAAQEFTSLLPPFSKEDELRVQMNLSLTQIDKYKIIKAMRKQNQKEGLNMEERNDILEKLGVSIYKRDGEWYWMIKSRSFDSPEGALKDAISSFSRETEKRADKKEKCFA